MKNLKLKYYIIEIILFIVILAICEFINFKFLNGNVWTMIGIFLICVGIFVIILSRLKNKKM